MTARTSHLCHDFEAALAKRAAHCRTIAASGMGWCVTHEASIHGGDKQCTRKTSR